MTILIRPLIESDLDEADRIMRLAFGTFIGLEDPMAMWGDGEYAHSRWRSDLEGALAAEHDGRLAGSNFAVRWGSLAYFGPLSVHPELWDQKVGQHLVEATMAMFERWGVRHRGLYTFAQSPKHIALYQRYGFWPRFLSAVMQKEIAPRHHQVEYEKFSALSASAKAETVAACRELTDSFFAGLDLRREIEAADRLRLGETIIGRRGSKVAWFAVTHIGRATEAGSGVCFIKFAATRPGARAERDFDQMLDACETLALDAGAHQMRTGVNFAREEAHRKVAARGFRAERIGVVMQSPNEPAYNRPGNYILDDWR
ncbi:MAG: GNAT family N-acetyltransferase [Candidatus Binataceae bacterium]